MAITFVNNALGGTTTTTSFSITLPTTQAGDIIILEYTHRGTPDATLGGTYSGPAFAEKHDQLYATSTFSGKTLWSRATGNHAGQTVTGSGLTDSCAAIVTVYRGALSSGDPLADATIVGEQNASGNETQAAITTATNGAWVVLVVANSPDVAVTSQSCTSPGALTARAERLSTGGTDTSIAHASAEKATAGSTGAFTWAQTNGAGGSWAYAITPEPLPAPTLGLEMDVPRSAAPSRRALDDGFIGPNLILTTFAVVAASAVMCRGPLMTQTVQTRIADPFEAPNLLLSKLAADMAAAPTLRGPSTLVTTQRIVSDPPEAPNLLLGTLAQQAAPPFTVNDPGTGRPLAKVVFPDNAPANILLLSPRPSTSSNETPSVVPVASVGDTHRHPLTLGIPGVPDVRPIGAQWFDTKRTSQPFELANPPNTLLSTLKLAADMAAAPTLRGASTTLKTIARPTTEGFEAPNLLLRAVVAADPLPIGLQNQFEYRPVPRVISHGFTHHQPLALGLPPLITAMCRGPLSAPSVSRIITDPFEAPNLLLTTLGVVVTPDPLPIGLQDQFDYRPVPKVVSGGSSHSQPLTLGIPAPVQAPFKSPALDERPRTRRAVSVQEQGSRFGLDGITGWAPCIQEVDATRVLKRITRIEFEQPSNILLTILAQQPTPLPIGLQDVFDYRPVPKVVSKGSEHRHPLTLGIPPRPQPPFTSPLLDERPRVRRSIWVENQGSRFGLDGILGWGPVIQEVDGGRVLKRISRLELEQPQNILLTTLAQPPQALPIGKQWFVHRSIPQPIAASVPPNTLLTVLAQQQPLLVGTQSFDRRVLPRPVAADVPPNILITTLAQQPQPLPIGAQWYNYRPIGRPIAPTVPPNLLLSTLVPQPFPVSIHNAHWEFERQITQNVLDFGSFSAPLLTLGLEPAILLELVRVEIGFDTINIVTEVSNEPTIVCTWSN